MNKQIKFLHKSSKKQYFNIFLLLITTGLVVALTLFQAQILGFVIDNVINNEPIQNSFLESFSSFFGGAALIRENLWITAVMMISVALLTAFFMFTRSRLNGIISEGVAFTIKNDFFTHLMHLPYKFYVNFQSGDLIQRATSDVDVIKRFFSNQIAELFYALTMVILSFSIMFSKHRLLSLISLSLLPFIFIFAIYFFKRVQKDFNDLEEADAAVTAAISENLGAVRVIKAFNREAYEVESFDTINRTMSESLKKLIDSLAFYWGFSDFMCFTSILLVVISSVYMVSQGTLSIGDATIFMSYQSMMVWPLRQMGRILADMGKVNVASKRLVEVLEVDVEDLDTGLSPILNGDLELEHVSFAYDDDPHLVLKDVSFSIKHGENVAILGPTGSGKSSLIHLLAGLYPATSGTIKLSGYDIESLSLRHLRQHVALVLQEPFLFSKSILENIGITQNELDQNNYNHALRVSHVDSFLKDFDEGDLTMVGEKGTTLSGGQKQRVAIARTLVQETPILIFDDSLSAVDTETDALIRQRLQDLNRDMTTIIITQRIASCENADKIFVLEDGVITQSGTHETLSHEEGLYKRVKEIQNKKEGIDDGEAQSNQ